MSKERQPAGKSARQPAPRSGHHTILSLEVTGGFLKGAKLELADGLNCIIGGRGTGKTTVLELIRYVLGLVPDERTNSSRAKALHNLVESNLKNGRVRLSVLTKHGMRYTAERPFGDTTQVFNEHGEPTAVSFDRDLIFKADVYGQNEIEEIAVNPRYQLNLIDQFVDEEVRRIDGEIRQIDRALAQSAADLLRLDREMRDMTEGASEAPLLLEKLKALQTASGPDAKAMNAAHARRASRDKERTALGALRSDMGRVNKELGTVVMGLKRRLESRLDPDLHEGPNEDLFAKVQREVESLVQRLERAASGVSEQCAATDEALAHQEQALAERHAKQEAEYRDQLAQSQEESGRAAERHQLQQRYQATLAAQKELELRKAERRAAEAQRRELIGRLSGLRDERFALRKQVAERLTESLKPTIRVSVTQQGSHEAYNELLHEALRRTGMKYAVMVDRIAAGATPDELCRLVQRGDAPRLAERVGFDEERARKVVEALKDTELVYRIETVELEDLPRIELLDGKGYKDSTDLSTGQRCTTILPILLLESERPLLIDQPEDNLDNAFIYETVVKNLTATKAKRQLIFVTHNPNIPVLGDAERVFVLESDGAQGKLKSAGTVDALKHEIELLLEGGSEAFLLRKQRYGH